MSTIASAVGKSQRGENLTSLVSVSVSHVSLQHCRVVRLPDRPKFTTISYVWGSGTKTISIDGCDLEITENCFNALAALRAQYGALTIWVDAICINQNNKSEKSSQIPLMKEIYTWAETVYIWLGNGNEQSYAAMDCLCMVPKKYQCLYLTHWAASPSSVARTIAALLALLQTLYYIPSVFFHSLTHSTGHGGEGKVLFLIKLHEVVLM